MADSGSYGPGAASGWRFPCCDGQCVVRSSLYFTVAQAAGRGHPFMSVEGVLMPHYLLLPCSAAASWGIPSCRGWASATSCFFSASPWVPAELTQ
eukprot:scaffold19616_cov36-Prasinocladus_malaysianus.AAC.2